MTWVKLDDQFPIHRKVAVLSDVAYRLHTEGLCWCARNLTDGFIHREEVQALGIRARPKVLDELVRRDVWHAPGHDCKTCAQPIDGWVIHDYLKYNPTAVEVREDRRKKAEKQRNWRAAKGGRSGSTDSVTDRERDGLEDGSVTPPPRAHVSRPAPPRPEGSGAGGRPDAPPAAFGGRAAAGGGAEDQNHRGSPRCPTCGNPTNSAYHRGACQATTWTGGGA